MIDCCVGNQMIADGNLSDASPGNQTVEPEH